MKKLILLSLITIISSIESKAQTSPISNPDCYIRYFYDNAGNRIKRDFFCGTGLSNSRLASVDANPITEQNIKVFPNPAVNYVSILLSKKTNHGKVCVKDIQSRLLSEHIIIDKLNISIEAYSQGIYLIEVILEDKKTVFKIEKRN